MAHHGRTLVSVIIFFSLVFSGGAAASPSWHGTEVFAAQDATLTTLEDLDQLQDLFNQRAGVPRLILLLSPT